MTDTELKELIEDCCNEIDNKIEPLANVKARLYASLKPAINYTRCSTQLLCVNSYKTWDTTQGKLYKIKSESEKEYRIINDSGKEDSYFKKHFKKVEDK